MLFSQWFHQQLQASTKGFLWAVEQIPQEHQFLPPKPDKWSVARLLYHMVCYDQLIGLPTLSQWVGGPSPLAGLTGSAEEDAAREETRWNNGEGHDVQAMLADFNTLRAEQFALIQHFPEQAWSEKRNAIWGPVTLQWVVTKTYQHTLEHTDEILRAYLWGNRRNHNE
jgi:hypothetical protein